MISDSARAWWSSSRRTARCAGTVRSPPGPRATTCAPVASAQQPISEVGSAWARLPPIVPRLRTRTLPTCRTAVGEQRAVLAHQVVLEQDAVPGEGGQPEHAVGHGRLALVGGVDVDEQLGVGEPEVEHRHQALPAGQDLGLVAAVGQQAHRLVVAAGGHVLEGRCDHQAASVRSRATAAASTAWLLVTTGRPSRSAMAGPGGHRAEVRAGGEDQVDAAARRPAARGRARRTPRSRRARPPRSAKLSVMPSPVMPATSIPSASMLALIFSFSSSTYGVITPMLAAPDASMAVADRADGGHDRRAGQLADPLAQLGVVVVAAQRPGAGAAEHHHVGPRRAQVAGGGQRELVQHPVLARRGGVLHVHPRRVQGGARRQVAGEVHLHHRVGGRDHQPDPGGPGAHAGSAGRRLGAGSAGIRRAGTPASGGPSRSSR